jgi:hypothetical protein
MKIPNLNSEEDMENYNLYVDENSKFNQLIDYYRTRKSLIFTLKNIFVNKKNTKNLHTTLLDM